MCVCLVLRALLCTILNKTNTFLWSKRAYVINTTYARRVGIEKRVPRNTVYTNVIKIKRDGMEKKKFFE